MQQLESLAYESPRASEERQVVYQVGDLESLSSVGLYSDAKNIIKKDGTIETIFPKISEGGTAKIYMNPYTYIAEVAAFQKKGEKHSEYAEKMKNGGGVSLGGISMPSSSCSGGY